MEKIWTIDGKILGRKIGMKNSSWKVSGKIVIASETILNWRIVENPLDPRFVQIQGVRRDFLAKFDVFEIFAKITLIYYLVNRCTHLLQNFFTKNI